MALTAAELARFRRKIGDTGTTQAYSDDELQDLYTEAGEVFAVAVRDAIDELIGNAWKFTDYTQNASQEKKSQIMTNLLKIRAIWQAKVDALSAGSQTRIVGLKAVPPRRKDKPRGY